MGDHMKNTTLKHVKIVLTYESGEERNVEIPLTSSGTLVVYDSEPYVIEKGPDLTKSFLKKLGLKTPRKARPRRSPARRPPRR